ncbi:gamma carbonic anhydrase family protein [Clostridium bowmanii]|uniref:gamma carbonic anhydrase family protein n=1 Tax=Clostridium bowmanii TaxID=132925 RepID=UPI001C0E43D1|nr:gamma carbonic anhydrase family protein [Clostridium bowmanii]MBU3190679.1 gamma carbonic anhydrase family protein [Clostridium bowmanii]MCA1072575.1 gamma carbonic anhydrase family protein [Clostridium bowmanii]
MVHQFDGKRPKVQKHSFIAISADVIGNVTIGEYSNIWFGAVLRGDMDYISIGDYTNIQDNCTVHNDKDFPVYIGDYVTVGHNAIIHGCKISNYTLIGMGSTILNGAEIGEYTIIGAGSLVTQGKKIPSGVLCMGVPAKVIRELTIEEKEGLKKSALHYVELSMRYILE